MAFIEREYVLPDGSALILTFNCPEQIEEHTWACKWSLNGEDLIGYGVDGLQALLGAMTMAHANIRHSYRGASWHGMKNYGLPTAHDLFSSLADTFE